MQDERDAIEWERIRRRYDAEKAKDMPNLRALNLYGNQMLELQSGSLNRTGCRSFKPRPR